MAYLQPLLAGSCAAAAIVAGIAVFDPFEQADTPAAISVTEPHDISVDDVAAGIVGEQSGPPGRIPEDSVADVIEASFAGSEPITRNDRTDAPLEIALREAYAKRIYDPVWTEDGARDLLARLELCRRSGIGIQTGLIERVESSIAALYGSPQDRASADLYLSRVFLSLADRERNGLDAEGNLLPPDVTAVDPEPLDVQLAYAGEGDFDYSRLSPRHPEFGALLDARTTYAAYVADGDFTLVPAPVDDVVEVGDSDPAIAVLRDRLAEEGFEIAADLEAEQEAGAELDDAKANPEVPPENRMTEAVSDALTEFQRHNGLETDGILGPNTLAALNVSAAEKVRRIDANIERWRQAPPNFGPNHIRVNIPAYEARAYENGREALSMRVIVGQNGWQTPVFAETVEYVIANPRWYVPESILGNEQLGRIRTDPDYIARNGFYVLDRHTGERVPDDTVDWDRPGVENDYRLVQTAGSGNALGTVKIMFPNQYSVYLHDTPADSLFERSYRALSHGCVRLERPHEMARWVLRTGGSGDRISDIDTAWNTGVNTRFDLAEPIPVYLVYFTVEVDDDGDAVFHQDIYDRDQSILQALAGNEMGVVGSQGA
ncbi:MAG: L,D-transpeptidase family protein [Alphaproteobacteria bacterium]|nr:L,D-transpeptidase family protein [Alphaproteobacteria bacterium]